MLDRHFNLSVAGSTECDEIPHDVRFVNVNVRAAGIDMVNVEVPAARTAFGVAPKACPISFYHGATYPLPKASFWIARAAAPVGTLLTYHRRTGAGRAAILPPVCGFGRERLEDNPAMLAGGSLEFAFREVATRLGTVPLPATGNCLPARLAMTNRSCRLPPSNVAFTRAEFFFRLACRYARYPLELLLAVSACQGNGLTNRVNGALA